MGWLAQQISNSWSPMIWMDMTWVESLLLSFNTSWLSQQAFWSMPQGLFCAQHRACTSAALLHQCLDNMSFSSWRHTDAVRWCSFLDNITEVATQFVLACMRVQNLWICPDLSAHFPYMTRSSRKANRRPSSRTVYYCNSKPRWGGCLDSVRKVESLFVAIFETPHTKISDISLNNAWW